MSQNDIGIWPYYACVHNISLNILLSTCLKKIKSFMLYHKAYVLQYKLCMQTVKSCFYTEFSAKRLRNSTVC